MFKIRVGDEILPSTYGDFFINHEIKILIKQPGFHGKDLEVLFSPFVAHIASLFSCIFRDPEEESMEVQQADLTQQNQLNLVIEISTRCGEKNGIYAYIYICCYALISSYTHIHIYLFIYSWFSETLTDLRKVRNSWTNPDFMEWNVRVCLGCSCSTGEVPTLPTKSTKKEPEKNSPPKKSKEMHGNTHTNHQRYSILGVPFVCFLLFWFLLVCMCASQLFCVWICSLLRLHLFLSRPDSLCHECRLAFLGQRGLYLRMANLCQLQYAICVLHRCGKSGLQSPIESDQ